MCQSSMLACSQQKRDKTKKKIIKKLATIQNLLYMEPEIHGSVFFCQKNLLKKFP